jgi:cobalt-zinc-cadmium efflux system protein
MGITLGVLAIEVIGAIVTGSLALLADAAHLLTDAAGLGLALIAAALSSRPPTPQRTWGFQRAEVLAAAAQAAVLLAIGGFVLFEGVRRLFRPDDISPAAMTAFGLAGLAGNAVALGVLFRARADNLNMRAAFLEVLGDGLGTIGVITAGVVISITGWTRADAVASLVIGALIVPRTVRLLRESLTVLLESTPPGLELANVRDHVLSVPHVVDLHDLHATLVSTGLPVLTAHVVVDDECFRDGHVPDLLTALQDCLAGHFDVEHCTFQFETSAHAAHEQGRHD